MQYESITVDPDQAYRATNHLSRCLRNGGAVCGERLLLTVSEAAEQLGVSRSHFYEFIRPRLPVVKLGRSVRIRRADLEMLVERLLDEEDEP